MTQRGRKTALLAADEKLLEMMAELGLQGGGDGALVGELAEGAGTDEGAVVGGGAVAFEQGAEFWGEILGEVKRKK